MLPQNTLPPSLSDFTPPEVTLPRLPPPPLIVQEHWDKSQEPTVSRCTDGLYKPITFRFGQNND